MPVIIFSAFVKYMEKIAYNEAGHLIVTDFK